MKTPPNSSNKYIIFCLAYLTEIISFVMCI